MPKKKTKRTTGQKAGITRGKLLKVAIAKDGKVPEIARALDVTPQAIQGHLQRHPEVTQAVENAREVAIRESRLSLTKAFTRVGEALDATQQGWGKETDIPDHDTRLKAAKLTAEFHNVVKDAQPMGGGQILVMPVIVVDGNPLKFKVGNNG